MGSGLVIVLLVCLAYYGGLGALLCLCEYLSNWRQSWKKRC